MQELENCRWSIEDCRLENRRSAIDNRQSKIGNRTGGDTHAGQTSGTDSHCLRARRPEHPAGLVPGTAAGRTIAAARSGSTPARRHSLLPHPRPAEPGAGQPQSFVEIVDRNVFSPLRGSQPPQPQEEAKAPKPPLLFGTMNLGNGWFALMAPGDQPSPASKRVLPGEEIGGYKLVSIGTSNVVIEWQEKKITLDISESARRAPIEKTASASPRSAPVTTAGSAANPAMPVVPSCPGVQGSPLPPGRRRPGPLRTFRLAPSLEESKRF